MHIRGIGEEVWVVIAIGDPVFGTVTKITVDTTDIGAVRVMYHARISEIAHCHASAEDCFTDKALARFMATRK